MSKEPVYVGIDLGATSFTVGLVTGEGELLASSNSPTLVDRGPVDIIDRMAAETIRLWEQNGYTRDEILEIGIGSPGPLDLKTGIVVTTPNLKWTNVPLRDMLAERLGKQVTLDNDGVSATFGEFWVGAGKPYDDVMGITLGTGVGGGLILGGRIHHGFQGIAGHIGHLVIEVNGRKCGCGNKGCLEAYASATGIVARTRDALIEDRSSSMHQLNPLTAKRIFEAAKSGDALALRIWDETGLYLAAGISSVMSLLNPEAIIILGSVANAGDILLNPINKYLKGMVLTSKLFEETAVARGTLGGFAGTVGAAGFARFR